METADDRAFLEQFEACEIARAQWTHVAHVRMAWLYLERHDATTALRLVRGGIRRLNDSFSNSDGYHETITVAFVRLIAARRCNAPPEESFAQFVERNAELVDRTLPALLRHYRPETLWSQAARRQWVEPDLAPLAG